MSHLRDREAAYRILFDDVYADAVRFAMRRADPIDADEAVSAAMATAWRRFDRAPDTLDARRAWVFGIVRKTLLNMRRSTERRHALSVRVANHLPLVASDDLGGVELRADLVAAWRALEPEQQEVLSLTIFEDLDAVSAARALGILPATYRVRLSRARKALRALLYEPDPDPDRRAIASELPLIH